MHKEIRELDCEVLAALEKAYPDEIAVIREMLAAIDERCLEQAA